MLSKLKPVLLLLLGVAVGLSMVAGVVALQRRLSPEPHLWSGLYLDQPIEAFNFQLQGAGNASVQLSDFRGRMVLLFFGYRSCPDVCPFTLSTLERALAMLGPAADAVHVILISVDPERDTPDATHAYAQAFSLRFIGLSGSPEQITAVTQPYKIYFEPETFRSNSGYLVTHSSTVTVIDRAGDIRLIFPPELTSAQMAADLQALLAQN